VAVLEALSKAAFEREVGRIDPRSAQRRGWTIVEATYPVLDVLFEHAKAAPMRLRLICNDWDEIPPSIQLLNRDGSPLVPLPPNPGQFNGGPHPTTGRPFVCMRGSREYHTHGGHLSDVWDNYRGKPGMDLGGLLFQLWQVWTQAIR
jgi:hypothetical protein